MGPTIKYRISEKAVTLAWEEKIDIDIHRQVMLADELISNFPFAGWIENVPGYHTLTIFFDPYIIVKQTRSLDAFQFVEDYLDHIIASPEDPASFETRRVRVPVCYDPEFGIDLEEVSGLLKIGIDDIIHEHCNTPYHVFMLGFQPGFPYMGMLPDVLKIPRKAVPSIKIPAGTVAIGGQQTGIYPFDSPGGWYALGRTPIELFVNGKAFFEPGDEVIFYPIDLDEYHKMKSVEH